MTEAATSAGSILDISKYRDTCELSISILHGIAILRYNHISNDQTILGRYIVRSGVSSNSINNIVYFQHRTQLHYNNNFYPTLGWLEMGWTEE